MLLNKLWFLKFCFQTLLFISFYCLQAQEIAVMEVVPDSPLSRIGSESVPFDFLTPSSPHTILASGKIPASDYRLLPSLDTLRVDHIFDSISSPSAFSFKPDEKEYRQNIAVKRKNDWLILDGSVFQLASPAGLKMSWIDVDGNEVPELLLSFDRTEPNSNVRSETSSRTDEFTGQEFLWSKNWLKARGFCIIDIEHVQFLVNNIYTGYEYIYQEKEFFREKIKNAEGVEKLRKGTMNEAEKYFKVWYDFKIVPRKKTIKVKLIQCEKGLA
ncbi:MAG TPA: hypothetical protein VIT44_02865, partial [Cyclobacteriaceae bacterium]